jgi:integrase
MRKPKKLPRGINIRKDRSRDWYTIRYTDQWGRKHREKASPTLEGAKAALERRKTEVRMGKFFPEKLKQRPVLFSEAASAYLKVAKGRKRSWQQDEDHVERLLPFLKDEPVADLTAGRLEEVLAEVGGGREWAPATFNRHRATLSALFQHAIKKGWLKVNPARLTAFRQENNQRVRFLTAEEEARLMAEVRNSDRPGRERDILVALHSGMRRSEQYRTAQVKDGGLKWSHINWRAGVIRLPRSKGNKPREIPMNSILVQTLGSIPQTIDSPFVFTSTDPEHWFEKLVSRAAIEDFNWHDLVIPSAPAWR